MGCCMYRFIIEVSPQCGIWMSYFSSVKLDCFLEDQYAGSTSPLFVVVLMVEDGRRKSYRECCKLEKPPSWELLVVGVTFKDGDSYDKLLVLILDWKEICRWW
ncbi:PREDICTED: uncharacterized protein LOC105135636 [Populus euphratica]|uniref:Uncharacterized protein LOC105135636 n=1 Tax=Populus euphratica TaxID=75702 RepID=A0AAJ6V0S8_POPEU|nr:PREDICTED: uncharacterized protein LOC105135636 [Populus euphratica]